MYVVTRAVIQAATISFEQFKILHGEVEEFRANHFTAERLYAPPLVVDKALVCQFYRCIHFSDEMHRSFDLDELILHNLKHAEDTEYRRFVTCFRHRAHEDDELDIKSLLRELESEKLIV